MTIRTIAMPKEMFDRWQINLRSGEYKQGTGSLCSTVSGENFYCCLGVLQHGEDGDVERHTTASILALNSYVPLGLPSGKWCNEKGIVDLIEHEYYPEDAEVDIPVPTTDSKLCISGLNDSGRDGTGSLSFVEIADILLEVVETY